MADVATLQKSWLANDKFKIVLDQADLGHVVGKVELDMEVSTEDERDSRELCAKTDQEIATFMQRYSWIFQTGHVTGELSVYFAQQAFQCSPFLTRLRL